MDTTAEKQWIEVTQRIAVPPVPDRSELIFEDGIPMESDWHRAAMNLLIEVITYFWRGRQDYYVGGNMFIYFDPDQVKKRNFRGPDFFLVKGIADNSRWREAWIVWEEEGLTPNLVVELTSASTEAEDKGPKKEIYERILRVPEYYIYNPYSQELVGWRLEAGHYIALQPNERGWLWSEEVGLWLGTWWGNYLDRANRWLRFFDEAGEIVPTGREAEAQAHLAEAEARRAEAEARQAAEAEVARLKAKLEKLQRGEEDE